MLLDMAAQKIGIENYFSYTSSNRQIDNSNLLCLQHHSNFLLEIRSNYDATNSFSINAGKSFAFSNDKISASVKPMIGFVIGSIKGLSFNADHEIEWRSLYFSSKVQYFLSSRLQDENFLYIWLESGICFFKNFFSGFSLQRSFLTTQSSPWSKGLVIGFSSGRWSFPIYLFDPFSCRENFVVGVFYNIDFQKR